MSHTEKHEAPGSSRLKKSVNIKMQNEKLNL